MRLRDLIGGAGVAVASFVICLEVQRAIARPRIEPSTIDRTIKGDRLPTVPRPSVRVPRPSITPASQPKLLEGCESSFSSIRNPQARNIVGRCLTAAPPRVVVAMAAEQMVWLPRA